MLLSGCHPLCVWYHCKTGQIENPNIYHEPEKTVTILMMETDHKDDSNDIDNVETSARPTTCLQITDL